MLIKKKILSLLLMFVLVACVFIGFQGMNKVNAYALIMEDSVTSEVASEISTQAVSTYTVILSNQDGDGGTSFVYATYGLAMPSATAPSKTGYTFKGYYTGTNGSGTKYYNSDMTSARNWDITSDTTLYAYWIGNRYEVQLYVDGGTGGTTKVEVRFGESMPAITVPSKTGYNFLGYYDKNGTCYYTGPNGNSARTWDKTSGATLEAHWEAKTYTITLRLYDTTTSTTTVKYGEEVNIDLLPMRTHYEFLGYYSQPNGQGVCYTTVERKEDSIMFYWVTKSTGREWTTDKDGELHAHWKELTLDLEYDLISEGVTSATKGEVSIKSGQSVTLTAPTWSGYTFHRWNINGTFYTSATVTYTFTLHLSYVTGETEIYLLNDSGSAMNSDGYMWAEYTADPNCVAAGTLITLADGRQVPVELLTGNEMLLVWNMRTGSFDSAPILFIDHDAAEMYKIINLYFSDGTHVKVIDEHAFWDFDLNRYVFLRDDAAQYIGHWFNKQVTDDNGNMIWTRVQLANVTITEEYTTAWSPVTYGHLCIYVNGMLSMPGATEGLINIFEVDGDAMRIDEEKYLADVATYGLFTYEEFAEIYPIPEEMFNAVDGQYLKVSIGKGLIDYETLGNLISSYSEFFE